MTACDSNYSISDLKLNNGDKWKVNAEMKPHIEMGNEILKTYLAQKGTNYHELAEDLKNQNNTLIKSCTMKGASHDELHKWLHPHMALIQDLSKARDSKEAELIVSRIEQSFKIYNFYFE
jgi:hypothetical protein